MKISDSFTTLDSAKPESTEVSDNESGSSHDSNRLLVSVSIYTGCPEGNSNEMDLLRKDFQTQHGRLSTATLPRIGL